MFFELLKKSSKNALGSTVAQVKENYFFNDVLKYLLLQNPFVRSW